MAPFPIDAILGKFGAYLIYLLIGVGFGSVLEMAGFAHSPKLAAQFYLKDMTVLKVMFTAIIVAMTLIFLSSGLMLLDFDKLWVNPTYLWPGIIGGLIMGVGFIIGGFCPGTSLVALATLRVDGFFFVLGATTGIFIFGETVSNYTGFWTSSYLGRIILPEVFHVHTGVIVLLVILMALFMFKGGEMLEAAIGKKKVSKSKWKIAGASALVILSLLGIVIGQPSVQDKWEMVSKTKQVLLDDRQVQVHPGELLDLMYDDSKNLVLLDVRPEKDYNIFHIKNAKMVELDDIPQYASELLHEPANTVIVAICNNEKLSTTAWKWLTALNVPNVYILEGGINNWLDIFGHEGHESCYTVKDKDDTSLRHIFNSALGSRYDAAEPEPEHQESKLLFEPKVKIATQVRRQGGCG